MAELRFFVEFVVTRALILGLVASTIVFLSAYGGMVSLAQLLAYGVVVAFSPAYLPSDYTFYAIILTFALLAVVLAVRPYGLFGRPE